MIYILFLLLQCVSSSPVIFDVTENNPVCGYSYLKLPVYSESPIDQNSHAVVFTRLPSHGNLYLCEDTGTCESYEELITESSMVIDSLSALTLVYVPDEDYFNHRHLVEYADTVNTYTLTKNGSTTCTQLECFDYFQYFIPDWSIGQTRRIRVTGRSSVPQLSVPLAITGTLSSFASSVNLIDPDEDFYETEFLLVSDQMKFESSSDPKITCQDSWCKIRSVPSQLPAKLTSIAYDFFQPTVTFNRLFLSVLNKYQLDRDVLDGEVCYDLPSRLSKTFAYTTIQHDSLPAPVAFYVSTDTNVFQNNDVLPSRGRLAYDGKLTYTPFNPYTFSVRSVNDQCVSEYYDQFNLESFVYMEGACVGIPNKTVNVCLRDTEKQPFVVSKYVDDIYLETPKLFKVDAFDANDFTWGEDDPSHSWFSFYDENKSVNVQSGVVFTTTRFDTGEIRDAETCENALVPGRLYNTTVFCYMSLLPNAYETTGFAVSDNVGAISNTGVIVFENPHNFFVCSAEDTSGMDAPCTATGKESNPYTGNTQIKIAIQVNDTSPVELNFHIEVRSLPANGVLYHCSDANCNVAGARVKIGDSLKGKGIGIYPYFIYIGRDHYYNYNIYDIGMVGGIAEIYYKDCADTCKGNVGCLNDCQKQREKDKHDFPEEYIPSFTDRKNVPIGNCYHVYNFGCPDTFLFDVETIEGVYPNNRYNVYVSNVGSGFSLRKTVPGGDLEYIPGDTMPFQLELTDWDGDNWDIALYISMGKAFIGSRDALENVYVHVDDTDETSNTYGECFDNGECGGFIKVFGLPSDIRDFLKRCYFSYFPEYLQSQTGMFSITGYKLYWGPNRKNYGIPVFIDYLYMASLSLDLLFTKNVFRTNAIIVNYRPQNQHRGVVLFPPLSTWEQFVNVMVIVITITAYVATSYLPSGPIGTFQSMIQAGRQFAVALKSGFTVGLKLTAKMGAMIGRGALRILRGFIGISRKVFSMFLSGIRSTVRRVRNFPRRKPPTPANVKPPVAVTDDASRLLVVRDAPIITNPTRSFPATVGRVADDAVIPPNPPGGITRPKPVVVDDTTTFVGPVSRGGRLGRVTRASRAKIVGIVQRLRSILRRKWNKMKDARKKRKLERKAKKLKKKQLKRMKNKIKAKKPKIKGNKFKYRLKFMRRFLLKLVKGGFKLLSRALWETFLLFWGVATSIFWGTMYMCAYIIFSSDDDEEAEGDTEQGKGYFVEKKPLIADVAH